MSGARGMVAPPPANGAFAAGASASVGATCGRAPKRWPTTSAMRETSAMAATAHGSTAEKPRDGAAAEPAGVPQRWQKRAPGVSGAEQVPHVAPSSAVPQVEQKRPDAGAPHD